MCVFFWHLCFPGIFLTSLFSWKTSVVLSKGCPPQGGHHGDSVTLPVCWYSSIVKVSLLRNLYNDDFLCVMPWCQILMQAVYSLLVPNGTGINFFQMSLFKERIGVLLVATFQISAWQQVLLEILCIQTCSAPHWLGEHVRSLFLEKNRPPPIIFVDSCLSHHHLRCQTAHITLLDFS